MMRILLTNDDGIGAAGLLAMCEALKGLGEVTVAAPRSPKSGAGHSITIYETIACRRISIDGETVAFSIEGSPADCVKVAVMRCLEQRPDLVVSGINLGSNVGINVLYSGTVAAAVEGAMLGIPSVAVSARKSETNLARVAGIARRIIEQFIDAGLASPGNEEAALLNINVPHLAAGLPKGVRLCRQSLKGFQEIMDHKGTSEDGDALYQLRGGVGHTPSEAETDIHALGAGYVAITPLKFDLTNDDLLKHLEGWKPEL
ncbi:MAG: 5'/3'-nucleotidase SurE [Phycisphaerae bacterium]|jgi:5'-nucleotidase|nr:5'/3'-nucleotidase SurE [Phycisphaerae bacterium]